MVSPRYWSVVAVALLGCSLATPLPSPQARGQDVAEALSTALGAKAPATSFRVDVLDAPADGADNSLEEDDPTRQLSPTTQSFLSTLGTALGPIVGAIVGPLLTNIGQNLSAGSGAQAIAQLQQAAQAAVAAQQQQQAGNPAAAVAAAAAAVDISGSGPTSTTPSSTTSRPRPQTARPTRRPGARPARPNLRPSVTVETASPAPSPAPLAAPHQSFDAFVLDVPGKGPFLFLMTPNATAAEQSAAIKQAQQQAAHLLAVDGQASPIGGVASLIGTTPSPQVTKPTSVGPLPVRPVISVTPPPPPPPLPNPLPSYHSLLEDDEQDQQGEEEVAVEAVEAPDSSDEQHSSSGPGEAKEDDSDFSSQSFLERLFPEMI